MTTPLRSQHELRQPARTRASPRGSTVSRSPPRAPREPQNRAAVTRGDRNAGDRRQHECRAVLDLQRLDVPDRRRATRSRSGPGQRPPSCRAARDTPGAPRMVVQARPRAEVGRRRPPSAGEARRRRGRERDRIERPHAGKAGRYLRIQGRAGLQVADRRGGGDLAAVGDVLRTGGGADHAGDTPRRRSRRSTRSARAHSRRTPCRRDRPAGRSARWRTGSRSRSRCGRRGCGRGRRGGRWPAATAPTTRCGAARRCRTTSRPPGVVPIWKT